jgi:3-deoxy-7-phosphoheptulonate synthase
MPDNQNIESATPLVSPRELKEAIPLKERGRATVGNGVQSFQEMLSGKSEKVAIIVWPCSIHDVQAAYEYAEKLKKLRETVGDNLELIMRVYFEKPRTTTGWKGLITDPELNGEDNMAEGIRIAREIMAHINELGVPTATEWLDPLTPAFLGDTVAWGCVGARTTESQTHRQMASGLSMPVGFKNSTDGSVINAINGMRSAQWRHAFSGIDEDGRAATIRTKGNKSTHVVLRGGKTPNYRHDDIETVITQLRWAWLPEQVFVDCSHENSGKDHRQQAEVAENLIEQIAIDHERRILGIMLESHLYAGSQKFEPGITTIEALKYWVSITDKCMDWDTTEGIIHAVAEATRKRNKK